ncbi:hypothetical protein, partial [Mongoliibacter sp.]|uniref:hypothetical protein n=1 Tax=Mongoliibacter sp. TaxID=2022438 RepID=UPI0025FA4BF3
MEKTTTSQNPTKDYFEGFALHSIIDFSMKQELSCLIPKNNNYIKNLNYFLKKLFETRFCENYSY